MERRLAAILAADVVGYTRLMAADEAGTLERLTALRTGALEPLIAGHRGRIVKLMGDGILAEFASLVDAVGCAVAWQAAVEEHEKGEDEDRRLRFRIGINLGDVIVEGDDIYGDGVNVAARLEGLAEPGEVWLSNDAYRQVRGKLDTGFEDLGEHKVKNLAEPLRVWRVVAAPPPPPASAPSGAAPLPLPEKPSIAVLPFDNMSGDPDQEFFVDGITEDLITALSKIRWFFVIARNSTFTYKGQATDVTRVAGELGVRYVLEGSVRRSNDRVRITAQLIDATTGHHVWAERYDRGIEDVFALQDEMTQTIVGAVEPELGAAERTRAARKPPGSLDAWETFQRGLWHLWQWTAEDNREARRLLRRAQELDPGFAAAYARESYSHFMDAVLGYADKPEESVALAIDAARRALALDDKDPVAWFAIGRAHMLRGDHDASIAELRTALELDPSFAQAHHGLGFALALAGCLDEAVRELDTSIRLSPRDPLRFATETIRAFASLLQQEYGEAVDWARKAILEPAAAGGGYWPHAVLAAALAGLGRTDEARAAVDAALAHKPDLSVSYVSRMLSTKSPDGLKIYLDGLRKAGLPE